MNQEPSPNPKPLSFSSFRAVVILVAVFVIVWVFLSITHFLQTRQQLHTLLIQKTEDMAKTAALADQYMSKVLDRLEEEQEARLIAIGSWLRDLDAQNSLTDIELRRVAEETGAFNIVFFNHEGRREFGLRGFGPPAGGRGFQGGQGRGRRGMGASDSESLREFLESELPFSNQGFHRSRGSGEYRYTVYVRRRNGGVISINIDAETQEKMRQELGPEALLAEFASRPEVIFIQRRHSGQVDLQFGTQIPQSTQSSSNPTTFDVEVDVPGQETTTLLVGFDANLLKNAESELLHRLIFSVTIAFMLGILSILWTKLYKRHGRLAQTLQQIYSYHRALLEQIDDAVIAWENHGGLTFWNHRAALLFPELGFSTAGNSPPAEVLKTWERIKKEGTQTIFTFHDNRKGTRRFRATLETIQSALPTNLIILTDVTEVELATSERRQREHMEALAKVASGVAHEVRNPLNAIDMTIQTLCMEPTTLHTEDRQTLDNLREEIKRINNIVKHFLDFGRPQPPVMSTTDIGAIVAEAASFLTPLAHEKNLQIHVDRPPVSPIEADAQQIRQVILNVVTNAIDAMEQEGVITLSVKQENNEIICSCRDEGIGMTQEQIDHIFDPYYTNKTRGTGLGMSIVKRIVDEHKGKIHINSAPGKGTEISIYFKQSKPQHEATNS
ncbi:MAG: GHKL domain-containing protein [Candidatus Omnitrophota bacterium]|jgi:signal transduction histidine kinase|nr:MAG: GHKL domain-containing protein [Candidatus Omnitrophota bacterium]